MKHETEEHAMTTNKTEIIFILDRSGSMGGLESDTIGGFNSMLAKQQAEPGEARITTVLFDHRYEVLHDRLDIKAVNPITDNEYFVRGNTALLDAVGRTIHNIAGVQRQSKPEYRADKVIFVITTDGMENASHEYTYEKVKAQIGHEKTKYGWEFIFLGANIDSVEFAGRFGVDRSRAQNYHNDGAGVALNYRVVSEAVASFRAAPCGAPLAEDWNAEIESDYRRRGGRK
jgi:uncharacterized protein YegL